MPHERSFFGRLNLPNIGYILSWILMMLCSLGFAYAFYLVVEKPSHQLARKIQIFRERRTVATTEKSAFDV
jgi:peptidoglycan/LPS O-acetylase OafA/YrhL